MRRGVAFISQAASELAAICRICVQQRYGRSSDQQMVGALRRRIRRLSLEPPRAGKRVTFGRQANESLCVALQLCR